jgi:energy-coupling factor transporter ATP-binding protein EcfA2
MISFSNINKQYGKQLLFVDASFQLNPGEKVGLVGPNGAGKTTLFRMVVGEESPDDGTVSVPKKLTIGYFRQDVEEMQGRSVLDEAIAGSGRVGDLHHELEALQREMSDPDKADDMDRILERFGHVQEEYEHLGGYALESQAREVLHGLGFKDDRQCQVWILRSLISVWWGNAAGATCVRSTLNVEDAVVVPALPFAGVRRYLLMNSASGPVKVPAPKGMTLPQPRGAGPHQRPERIADRTCV